MARPTRETVEMLNESLDKDEIDQLVRLVLDYLGETRTSTIFSEKMVSIIRSFRSTRRELRALENSHDNLEWYERRKREARNELDEVLTVLAQARENLESVSEDDRLPDVWKNEAQDASEGCR